MSATRRRTCTSGAGSASSLRWPAPAWPRPRHAPGWSWPPPGATRLHALADAYLGFTREQPHVHDLANGPTVAKADHPLLQQAAIEYWDLLHDAIAACQPQGTSEAEVLRRAAVTWSTVYGISRLSAFGQLPASVPATADELIHDAIDQLIAGWHQDQPDAGNARGHGAAPIGT